MKGCTESKIKQVFTKGLANSSFQGLGLILFTYLLLLKYATEAFSLESNPKEQRVGGPPHLVSAVHTFLWEQNL